jgi:pSer/pThr/pTyr-binding forkhead associated (FHA) protein
MPKLMVFRGRTKEATHDLDPDVEYIIGRGVSCTVHIDSTLVSRRHARVSWDGAIEEGAWVLEDLGGTNGLWVNGEEVSRKVLDLGDFVEFGRHVIVFYEAGLSQLEDLPTFAGKRRPVDKDESTAVVPPEDLARMRSRSKTRLATHVRWAGKTRIEELKLTEARYVIGFTAGCAIRLPGSPLFGKKAARLNRDFTGSWHLESLSSLAAVRINGAKVAGSREVQDGDKISVKGHDLTFQFSLVD